jgi:hypothetical protein
VRRSAAKLKGLDVSGSYSGAMKQRGQKAAVTRAANRLQAAQQSGRRRLQAGARQGVVRPGKGPRVMNPEVMPRDRVPASQRPGSMTSTLRGLMRGLAQADARRIREVEGITGQRVTMPSTPSGAGARVRATAKGGKVADTMRAGLRELAQSDARTIREMENIIRGDTPKVAGAKGGKALPGDKKALPEKKTAKPAIRGKGRIRMARPAGTVAKPKGLRPGVLAERRAARAAKALGLRARIDGDAFAARFRRARGASLRRAINESDRENALTSTQRRAVAPGKRYAASNMRQARADRTAAAAQDFYRNYGSPSAFSLRPSLSTANSPGFGSKRRSRRRR